MQAISLLEKLGFSEKEALIYVKILENPGISYAQLSSSTNINRTTCYSVVKQLAHKGFVVEDLGNKVVKLLAKDPDTLSVFFQNQHKETQKNLEIAIRASQELKRVLPKSTNPEPRLTYIEESKIKDYLYARTPLWNNSALKKDQTVWGFESAQFGLDFQDYIQWFWTLESSRGITLNFFTDHEKIVKQRKDVLENIHFKYTLPVDYKTNIWIYGNFTILQSLEEKPNYLIEVYEPLLSQNFRSFFKAMWLTSENLPGIGKAS